METFESKSSAHNKSKLARTFQKVCSLRTSKTKNPSNNGIGICMLASQNPNFDEEDDDGDSIFDRKSTTSSKTGGNRAKQKAVLEAVVAKIFASASSIKAAYAELQMAQRPYNSAAVQAADQAVVDELRALSELKRNFLRKELNLSPQVTMMLAEIQEQQSLMRTYEITIKKLEFEAKEKESSIDSLKQKLDETVSFNRSLEKKLNASGSISLFDNLRFQNLNLSHFVQILNYALRSIRSFVTTMVGEMDSARWDLNAAAAAAVKQNVAVFVKPSHRCFAFESFVCKKMFENFGSPNFSPQNLAGKKLSREHVFNRFESLRSANPAQQLTQNPESSFARFTRHKYASVVHAKMECSFFGNLNQRKLMNSGGFPPDSGFFTGFAEMAKRVWLLHCLAFSLHENVMVFQIEKGCRFSNVYMENVTSDERHFAGETSGLRVGFTVVPGFKIGGTVMQSQVYLSPASS